MIKYPEPGRVKTRLAGDIGAQKAALICRQITQQRNEANHAGCRRV